MTQSALFDAAHQISLAPSNDDPLIDCIKMFGKHCDHFSEDLTRTVDEFCDETLYDAMELRSAARELETVIGIISKRRTGLLEKAQNIINICQAAGHTREGNLQVISKESQGRRSVDRDKLIQERKDVYNQLLDDKIKSIETDFSPTIADLKTILKKQHEAYLKPGEITVTYDLEVILEGQDDS
jgi:hypothetical protein